MTSTCLLAMLDLQRSVLGGSSPVRAYTPYGGQSDKRGAELAFCGQARDQLTGHYHLGNGHRTYNPFVMRFNSADRLSPFGVGGINAYAYCNGDPINFHDPNGTNGIQSYLAAANVFIAASGAAKVNEQVNNLIKIKMIENRQKRLIGMGHSDLAGEPISNAVKKAHKVSLGLNSLKAGAGAAAGAIVSNTADVPEPSMGTAVLATAGALGSHVLASVFDALRPKVKSSYQDTLTELDGHLAALSQATPESNQLLSVVVHSLFDVVNAASKARSADTVDGVSNKARRHSAAF
ncbi:RHS repeat-associated core domain-containing protein [Pseudomonas mosselii]|uniref:RHS repeat-associated core domain-containing protein n=1 Tax=Pseudomonas mosselii TaxID=78327 RepID=UPI000D99D51F|nr:RHS repeat-associated core domain-containing protein [Pseudomonas mosselii]PYC19567.1 hypothetical protein DMX06_14800 [Pseudomonas mosselii]